MSYLVVRDDEREEVLGEYGVPDEDRKTVEGMELSEREEARVTARDPIRVADGGIIRYAMVSYLFAEPRAGAGPRHMWTGHGWDGLS